VKRIQALLRILHSTQARKNRTLGEATSSMRARKLLNRHSASVQEPNLNELKQTVFKFSLQKAAESCGVARLKKLNIASDPMRVNWHD
jgi:hypothetical protein